jgi:hypothetical protein
MTLDELNHTLPNGLHDADILSIELDYITATAKLRLSLLTGWPEDPDPERQAYQEATLVVTGLCFFSIDLPDPTYPFLPTGRPIDVSGDPAKPDNLPSLPDLVAKLPNGAWCYRLFVNDWNSFIHIAGRNAEITWIGDKPRHAK